MSPDCDCRLRLAAAKRWVVKLPPCAMESKPVCRSLEPSSTRPTSLLSTLRPIPNFSGAIVHEKELDGTYVIPACLARSRAFFSNRHFLSELKKEAVRRGGRGGKFLNHGYHSSVSGSCAEERWRRHGRTRSVNYSGRRVWPKKTR